MQRQLLNMQYMGSLAHANSVNIEWTHLYCARCECWYNDNLIAAFAKALEDTYGKNTTIFCQQ
ncbi:hypothetical protein JG687_00015636 [Phytophthora cactorum]|uniref:Uncharacterized protein n=1 Tax=Phytophthora cactorum TaxID=29920 RepID=A0A8T1TVE4_9STRA|nr:hypothetical protein JG687_00015636 [Phytophthora cactorum]